VALYIHFLTRLAPLQLMTVVHGTIEWAKNKLEAFPKAKKDPGPLLDALGRKSH
jgi:hypothetical protein